MQNDTGPIAVDTGTDEDLNKKVSDVNVGVDTPAVLQP